MKSENLELSSPKISHLFETCMAVRHVLFVRRNSRTTRSQIWRDTLQVSMRHLALNILPVMQGRKQLRNFRRVTIHQLLYLITGCNVNMASFVVSQEIAKRGKPYTDSEYIKRCFIDASEELFRDFKNKADILKKIKELPLSAKTMKDRTIKMCSNITLQQIEDPKLVSALSIAVDESCDINDTAQVSLFVRFISHLGPKEELLGLLPLKGQTRGEDIANAVVEYMDKYHIPLEKIVSISTDGAKSMTGVRKGFVAILKEKINHEILAYHCIIHQEALCAQKLPEQINKVMGLVISIINSIVAKALNHRQFKEFLVEVESEYADLLLHNKV
ncbi:hypothetical protein RN001_011712 [Aquatica leii]|uniref:DUF4371 domain-containing protein n=1 Tax=Aquatica leii TaxID=1421715 RepID=A0AAN7NXP0_9COLE|nr:hypothetical protein RN001_011712 [Aquatica leii]